MTDFTFKSQLRKRITPELLITLLETLTDREKDVLKFLDDFHYATGSQVQRLFFASGSFDARTRARNRLLTAMTDKLLIYRFPRQRLPGTQHGSTEHIYTLHHAGQRAMNELRIKERPFRSIDRTTAHFEHATAITELHSQLKELERTGLISIKKSQGEPASHIHYGVNDANILKPDATMRFHITKNSQTFEVAWFIEVERSRQGAPVIIAKIKTYQEYMRHLNAEKLMPGILFITFSDIHRLYIDSIILRNSGSDRNLFTTVLFANAVRTMTTDI